MNSIKEEVTQADREAAGNLAAKFQRYTQMQIEAPAIRRGEHDDWEFVKAFARHRTQSTSDLRAKAEGLAEALREVTNDLEAEIEAKRGTVLARTTERDLITVRDARQKLSEWDQSQ